MLRDHTLYRDEEKSGLLSFQESVKPGNCWCQMPRRNSGFCVKKSGVLGVILSKLEKLPPSLLLKPEGNYSRAVSDGAEWKGPLRVELKLEMHPQTVLGERESHCGDHRQTIILVSYRDSTRRSRSKGVTASRGSQAVLQHRECESAFTLHPGLISVAGYIHFSFFPSVSKNAWFYEWVQKCPVYSSR